MLNAFVALPEFNNNNNKCILSYYFKQLGTGVADPEKYFHDFFQTFFSLDCP